MLIYFHICDFCGRFNIPKSEIAKCNNKNENKNVSEFYVVWLRTLKTHAVLWGYENRFIDGKCLFSNFVPDSGPAEFLIIFFHFVAVFFFFFFFCSVFSCLINVKQMLEKRIKSMFSVFGFKLRDECSFVSLQCACVWSVVCHFSSLTFNSIIFVSRHLRIFMAARDFTFSILDFALGFLELFSNIFLLWETWALEVLSLSR